MERSWKAFLAGSETGHAVQIYRDVDELAGSVGDFLAAGLAEGAPAVVIVTPDHWQGFSLRLESLGWVTSTLQRDGLLTVADADETLAAFMDEGAPSAATFEQVVGGLVDGIATAFPGKRIRAFGEMVNVLSLNGQMQAALELEELWNRLAQTRDFSLLCGYELDVFDRAAQVEPLPGVCHAHSHVLPAFDAPRLARAVDRALAEVLGTEQAGKVYLLVGDQSRQNKIPIPQLALMWVSENMPVLANRVLATARANYDQTQLAPAS
ncbi:MAG: hypothetical protein QOF43_1141 [Gaiellaceae bacterium]|nr:hypothetical protein [Gaiellaceae bacterium]